MAEQKARIKGGLRRLEDAADPVRERSEEEYELPRPMKPGDSVLIYDIDKKATVLEVPEKGPVLVQAGILRTRVPVKNLRLLKQEKVKAPKGRNIPRSSGSTGLRSARASMELDLRGQTTDEALLNVDRFIDSALMAGLHQVTIIHGKGTGALRAAVQAHLKNHPSVKNYRLGVFGEGENGVTIAELK